MNDWNWLHEHAAWLRALWPANGPDDKKHVTLSAAQFFVVKSEFRLAAEIAAKQEK